MSDSKSAAPPWVARFLDALRAGKGVRPASRAAGVSQSTPYHRRKANPDFRAEWDAIQPVDGRRGRTGPAPKRDAAKIERFLEELAETSNVAAAAAVADLPVSKVYRLRRTDPDFARRWYAALSEGYDNLEMEVLLYLRGGGGGEGSDEAGKRKFDVATALRCLTAHRDSVAREKGRRTLADEVATIDGINARIDAMRIRAKEGEAAIRRARKDIAERAKRDGGA
jgi:hypothetical protein